MKEEFKKRHVDVKNALNIPYMFNTPEGRMKNSQFLEHVLAACNKCGHLVVGSARFHSGKLWVAGGGHVADGGVVGGAVDGGPVVQRRDSEDRRPRMREGTAEIEDGRVMKNDEDESLRGENDEAERRGAAAQCCFALEAAGMATSSSQLLSITKHSSLSSKPLFLPVFTSALSLPRCQSSHTLIIFTAAAKLKILVATRLDGAQA
ncbi:hypothetical protein LguiB_019040 [Lonicera macranthoides]